MNLSSWWVFAAHKRSPADRLPTRELNSFSGRGANEDKTADTPYYNVFQNTRPTDFYTTSTAIFDEKYFSNSWRIFCVNRMVNPSKYNIKISRFYNLMNNRRWKCSCTDYKIIQFYNIHNKRVVSCESTGVIRLPSN